MEQAEGQEGHNCMVTYPLDTAGIGLPVRELRLKVPILWRQRKRKTSMSPGPQSSQARTLGRWKPGARFLPWKSFKKDQKSRP